MKPLKLDLTRKQVQDMWNILEVLGDTPCPTQEATLRMADVRWAFRPHIEEIEKKGELPDDYQVYENARRDLCKEHAEKDEQGKPVTKLLDDGRSTEYVLDDTAAFNEALKALRESHKESIAEAEQQTKEWPKFMGESVKFESPPLLLAGIPQGITPRQMEKLRPVVRVSDDL